MRLSMRYWKNILSALGMKVTGSRRRRKSRRSHGLHCTLQFEELCGFDRRDDAVGPARIGPTVKLLDLPSTKRERDAMYCQPAGSVNRAAKRKQDWRAKKPRHCDHFETRGG